MRDDGFLNFECVAARFVVREEREWRDVARPMTTLAVLLENPDDFFVECDGRLCVKVPAQNDKYESSEQRFATHMRSLTYWQLLFKNPVRLIAPLECVVSKPKNAGRSFFCELLMVRYDDLCHALA